MQTIIVAIIISCATAYLGWRAYTAIRNAGDPCHGCKACALRDQARRARKNNGRKAPGCSRAIVVPANNRRTLKNS